MVIDDGIKEEIKIRFLSGSSPALIAEDLSSMYDMDLNKSSVNSIIYANGWKVHKRKDNVPRGSVIEMMRMSYEMLFDGAGEIREDVSPSDGVTICGTWIESYKKVYGSSVSFPVKSILEIFCRKYSETKAVPDILPDEDAEQAKMQLVSVFNYVWAGMEGSRHSPRVFSRYSKLWQKYQYIIELMKSDKISLNDVLNTAKSELDDILGKDISAWLPHDLRGANPKNITTENQVREWVRCWYNPVYWVSNYAWIEENETSSVLQFNPLPYRVEIISTLKSGESLAIDKCRRAGASWTVQAYEAHALQFRSSQSMMNLSKNQDDAKQLIAKSKFIIEHQALHDSDDYDMATKANWMQPEILSDNAGYISTAWRDASGDISRVSYIISLTTTSESGRSRGAGFIFIDEFGFIKPDDYKTWTAIRPTVMRGGQWCGASTPNGVGGIWYTLIMKARRLQASGKIDELGYKYMEVDWWHTEITEEMMKAITDDMDQRSIDQEFGRKFLSTGTPAFNEELVEAAYKPLDENPSLEEYLMGYEMFVEDENSREKYASGLDVSYGETSKADYNSWTTLTMTGIQVAHIYDKDTTHDWGGYLERNYDTGAQSWKEGRSTLLHEDYPGILVIEQNGPGHTVISGHNTPQHPKSSMYRYNTHAVSKRYLVELLREALVGGTVVITDWMTKECVLVYQDLGHGKYSAPSGQDFYDDPVVSLMLALHAIVLGGGRSDGEVVKIHLRSDQKNRELTEGKDRDRIRVNGNLASEKVPVMVAFGGVDPHEPEVMIGDGLMEQDDTFIDLYDMPDLEAP